jgi:hypothetical protein
MRAIAERSNIKANQRLCAAMCQIEAGASAETILPSTCPLLRPCHDPRVLRDGVEISPNPAGPDTWKRLPGVAASRSIGGYPPGTYLVRAASAKGQAESSFTGPVSVVVK